MRNRWEARDTTDPACPDRRRCDYVDPHHEGPCVPTPGVELEELKAALAAAGPVVEAARALVEHGWPLLIDTSVAKGRELEGLLDQLAARVRAHTDTTTEKG